MLRKSVLITMMIGSVLLADSRPNMPTPNLGDMNNRKAGCKVPEFLVSIPPMMEKDYIECVNRKFQPSKTLAQVVLKQQVNEKAELVSIEPAPRFYTRVFKITYKIGNKTEAMICNDMLTYCLSDKPIVSKMR